MSPFARPAPAATLDVELVEICGATPSWSCEALWELTGNRAVTRMADWLVTRPLAALVVLVVGLVVNRTVRHAASALIERVTSSRRLAASALDAVGVGTRRMVTVDDARQRSRSTTLAAVSRATVSWVVWSVVVLIVLGIFQVQLGPLLAGAGIAGVAIGFGAQSLVRDCISGFFMLLEDQCGVGDEVDLGHATGTVETLTLRAVQVRGTDGTLWTVPNGTILRVGNRTRSWSQGLVDVRVPAAIGLDEGLARIEVALERIASTEEVTADLLARPEVLGVEDLDATGVLVRVAVRTAPGRQWHVMRLLRLEIARSLALDPES